MKSVDFKQQKQQTLTNKHENYTPQISEKDADFLKARYIKLYEIFAASRATEQQLGKMCKTTMNEILAEKIVLEKTQIEEAEESTALRRLEETRNTLQKEMEFTEQRETMAKFELAELNRVHDELTVALASMKKENNNLVAPVMNRLRQEVRLFMRLHMQLYLSVLSC